MTNNEATNTARRSLAARVLLSLAMVLSSTAVHAERQPDYSVIQKRLDAAVIEGRLTQEEAQARWSAILRRAEQPEEHNPAEHADKARDSRQYSAAERLARAEKRLNAAVEAGDLTEDQARERLSAKQARMDSEREREAAARRRIKSIQLAVAAGEMASEDGQAAIRKMRRRLAEGDRGRPGKMDHQAARAAILEAIALGQITEVQAQDRLTRIDALVNAFELSAEVSHVQPDSAPPESD